ncbi:hypothetical protein Clacol_008165 [Clathrus columnatus]|uniref:LCCL domain-containing protein n=1 Tax=Clathrus columnatus TaxID=1419009 RepID=A0AAV5AK92_9AGAM|nr:hypothetical protein Clacol_008165 [Clathrus columnatus]
MSGRTAVNNLKMDSSSSSQSITLESLGSHKDSYVQQELADSDSPLAVEPALLSPFQRERWYTRRLRYYSSRYPKIYAFLLKCILYLRGPRPSRLLEPPTPFLDFELSHPFFRRFRFLDASLSIPIESTFIAKTRFLNRTWLMFIFAVAYIISLSFVVRAQWYTIPAESFITCTSTYWVQNDGCGLNGDLCTPFSNSSFDFRCPAQCKAVILQNPRAVGDELVDFVPLVVGGGNSGNTSFPGSYRGDSFICAAAVHAGLIDDNKGGCASVSLVGTQGPFESIAANGLVSAAFPSFFPLSLQFKPTNVLHHCNDLRNGALAFNILCSVIIFLFIRPKALVLFWCMVCMGYWHIVFFSQPVGAPPEVSTAFGTFLPTLFICHAFWEIAYRHVLPFFAGIPLERALWYLGAFWPGVLFNILTDKIPIDRLLASDIEQRPGAVVALVIIVIVLTIIIVNQLRVIRKTGWLLHYVVGYIIAGLIIMVLALLPGLQFRLHHYFAAILLMPLTAFPTRLSAIYQGFVLGMFLNGAAAFGFASILQTAAELQRDGPAGTQLPTILTNSSNYNSSIPLHEQILKWDGFPQGNLDGWNGFSLLIDDVERFAGNVLNFSLAGLDASVPHFFRLAFQQDGTSGDFTKAATLFSNGTWVDPLPGPSSIVMSSVALQWSSAFNSDRETWCKGETSKTKKPEYTPQAYYNGTEKGEPVWGLDLYPLQQVQLDISRERDPLQKRINRWLRQIGRAEGHDIPFHEDDVQQMEFTGPVWQEWGTTNDWLRAIEESGHLDPDPLADQVSDPKLIADFNFVEKAAKRRKLSERDSRRLHIVFRAPTEEKIRRINEIIKVLLPMVIMESAQNGSGSSSTATSR